MEIHYSSGFKKKFKKLPKEIQLLSEEKFALFMNNPFHPSLNTHKLSGDLKGLWVFSVKYQIRIVFEFMDSHTVLFSAIGGHEVYK